MKPSAPGTLPIVRMSTAAFTPYQHGGDSMPCTTALSEVVAPIEVPMKSLTSAPPCSSAHAMRRSVSSVEAGLPQASRWKRDEATTQPSRRSASSHGPSILSLTLPPWPWKKTATPLGSSVGGRLMRTGCPASTEVTCSPGCSPLAPVVASTSPSARTPASTAWATRLGTDERRRGAPGIVDGEVMATIINRGGLFPTSIRQIGGSGPVDPAGPAPRIETGS
ncbi:hypothetical protein ASF50_14820 [Nocardioides sp. Leaf307]|nr:hypothetical protein ASF50_14820 [Nocardioides sp. Leaf307]